MEKSTIDPEPIKLMIVQDGVQLLDAFEKHFAKNTAFSIVGKTNSGKEVLPLIEKIQPDIVIMDIILPDLDGFAVLEQLAISPSILQKPKMFILSALSNETFIAKAQNLGACYYMIKPIKDFSILEERLLESYQSKAPLQTEGVIADADSNIRKIITTKTKQLEEKISNIFITVGIPAHIKGYQFLREAIKMAINSPDIINSITKRLYPSIAQRFATSASKVERAIRHAIEVAWNRGKIENINSIFGVKVYSSHDKPTNGEFIALVADKMLIEGA